MIAPSRNPLACVVLSGLLLVASFPDFHLPWLGWVALAPLFAVCVQPMGKRRLFLFGWVAGGVFFAGTCRWVFEVMRNHGGLAFWQAAWVYVAYIGLMGSFVAAFAVVAGVLRERWKEKALYIIPFAWVAVEWGRNYLPFGGVPWNLSGYSIGQVTGWVQPASLAGVYGLCLMVAVVNAAVAACWLHPTRSLRNLLAALTLVLIASALLGLSLQAEPGSQKAVLVQSNLPQEPALGFEWGREQGADFSELEEITREAVRSLPGRETPLVIWPEIPAPIYFHQDPVVRGRLLELAQETGAYVVTGIIDYEEVEEEEATVRYPLNSAVVVEPTGTLLGQYDKIHLVPFGEYLPWADVTGLAGPLVQEVSRFRAGEVHRVLTAGKDRVAVFICYEGIFPALVRRFVQRDATVLVNISNDGWFGSTAAAAQHLNMARVRAVETRRYLLRATNTGITAVVDPYGNVVESAPRGERTALVVDYAPREGRTFYVQWGDWLAALCAMLTAGAVARHYWLQATEVTTDAIDGGVPTRV